MATPKQAARAAEREALKAETAARRRAAHAEAQARYRERLKAERNGQPVPVHAARQQEARYRPPRISGEVARASAAAAALRQRQAEVIASLPSVRNPAVNIYVPREPERVAAFPRRTREGQRRQAAAIRERSQASRIQEIGKARKTQLRTELSSGSQSDRLKDAMTASQQAQFQALSDRISRISHQALGILFTHEGGTGDYNAVIERILASPESRDVEEGLEILESLADMADRAGEAYAPSRVGRLNI